MADGSWSEMPVTLPTTMAHATVMYADADICQGRPISCLILVNSNLVTVHTCRCVFNAIFFLALESCYTEFDIQYKIENINGLTNLNADVKDKQQASTEDCRTYCRHIEHGSQYRRDQIVQIFVFTGTPTQRRNTSLSRWTVDQQPRTCASVSKITTWKRPGSIKRNGFLAMCNVDGSG